MQPISPRGICLALLLTAAVGSAQESVFPGENWEVVRGRALAEYGWSQRGLREAQQFITDESNTTGLIVVDRGRVVFQFGDVVELSYVASVRKSILSMLYGKYVMDGTIDLDKTIEDLGMDDIGGLLDIKPILELSNEGRIEPLDRVRGRDAVMARFLEHLEERLTPVPRQLRVGIAHGDTPEIAKELETEIVARFAPREIVTGQEHQLDLAEAGLGVGHHGGTDQTLRHGLRLHHDDRRRLVLGGPEQRHHEGHDRAQCARDHEPPDAAARDLDDVRQAEAEFGLCRVCDHVSFQIPVSAQRGAADPKPGPARAPAARGVAMPQPCQRTGSGGLENST